MGINLGRLQEFAKRGTGGVNYFKLNKKGSVRVRLLGDPFGDKENPFILADRHWFPVIDATGKEQRKFSQCNRTLGEDEFCPFCHLTKLMYSSEDPAMQEEARSLRAGKSYGIWVIDRTYMEERGSKGYDPEKEVPMLATIGSSIFTAIVELVQGGHWGEGCFYAEGGYDIVITGTPKPGTTFSEYKVSPVPTNASPDVDMSLLDEDKCKPLAELFPVKPLDAQIKLLQPILSSLADYGNVGASIVEVFLDDISGMIDVEAVFSGECETKKETSTPTSKASKPQHKVSPSDDEVSETDMPEAKSFREEMGDGEEAHVIADGSEMKTSDTRNSLLNRLGKK